MRDVIIVGSGPAGLAAGYYAGRRGFDTLFLERESIGGELVNREEIRNYPGFPDGISGTELRSAMLSAADDFDPDVTLTEVESVEPGSPDDLDSPHVVRTTDGEYEGRTVIVATGGSESRLGVPGEEEFEGMGVFYCAKCDGPLYRGETIAVVGGGTNAVTDALLLTDFAEEVVLFERTDALSADRQLREEVAAEPGIDVRYGTAVTEVVGEDGVLTGLRVEDVETGEEETIDAGGLYVHVGIDPNTEFMDGTVSLAEDGSVDVDVRMETDVEGIFAAGDVRRHSPRSIPAAVGDGVVAIESATAYVEDGTQH